MKGHTDPLSREEIAEIWTNNDKFNQIDWCLHRLLGMADAYWDMKDIFQAQAQEQACQTKQ